MGKRTTGEICCESLRPAKIQYSTQDVCLDFTRMLSIFAILFMKSTICYDIKSGLSLWLFVLELLQLGLNVNQGIDGILDSFNCERCFNLSVLFQVFQVLRHSTITRISINIIIVIIRDNTKSITTILEPDQYFQLKQIRSSCSLSKQNILEVQYSCFLYLNMCLFMPCLIWERNS